MELIIKKNNVSFIMKKFYGLLFIIVLSSCGDSIPTYQLDSENPYKIVRITPLNQKVFPSFCLYKVSSDCDHVEYIDNYNVIDSIGKFKIGDEVNFKLVISNKVISNTELSIK